jgi:putative oxidoreductase
MLPRSSGTRRLAAVGPTGKGGSGGESRYESRDLVDWRKILSPSWRPGLDLGLALLRLLAGLSLSLAHGLGKVSDFSKFTASIAGRGFPLPGLLGPAAALSEFLGGLLLALGLFTRPAAAMVLVTMSVAAFGVHADDPFKKKELALLYGGVAVLFVVGGPGRYSLDQKISSRWNK